jgi:hypothetical protein
MKRLVSVPLLAIALGGAGDKGVDPSEQQKIGDQNKSQELVIISRLFEVLEDVITKSDVPCASEVAPLMSEIQKQIMVQKRTK